MTTTHKRRRTLDGMVPYIAVGVMLLPALIPFLRTHVLPCTHDNMFHTFRIVAMQAMLRHGWLFSRWVPNLALGHGYPFFNYREPLPYLIGEGLFATGVPLPLVMGLLYAAGHLGAAWGAFVLGRDLFGKRAAWVAAVAYGLAPYLLMASLRRGNMPESVALGLLPWLFVVMRRLVLHGRRHTFLTAIVLLVALFLSHNISSLLLAPFLGLYVTVLVWVYRDRRTWPLAYGAVAIAALLAAWFWLPALTEQGWVQLHLSRSTRNNDFHYNFATWREMLLTVPAAYDAAYLNPPMRVYLGLSQVLLAVVGLGVGLLGTPGGHEVRREQRLMTVLFAVAALAYLWMSTPGALGVWRAWPMLSFVQFPWRLVGRALLPVALLAGLAMEGVGRRLDARGLRWRVQPALLLLVGVLIGLVVASWPDTYPPKGMCSVDPYPDMTDLYALERDGWMGMDPESSYFPVWVEEHPESTLLADAFVQGRLPERFDLAGAPTGTTLISADYRPLDATVELVAPVAFQARWLGLYFPGWEVRVDGERVPVTPEDVTGLLTFPVTAGRHRVEVRFGATPARRAGVLLSGLGLVAGSLVAVFWSRLHSDSAGGVAGSVVHEPTASLENRRTSGLILMLSVVLLGVRVLIVPHVESPVAYARLGRGELPEVAVRLDRAFEGGLSLLGATLERDRIAADEELPVELVWQVRETPSVRYRTTILLRGPDGQMWSPAGTARPRGYETPPPPVTWQPGVYVHDPHIVAPFHGTPPGVYEVVVALFDADTLLPASRLSAEGVAEGPDLVLGSVTVTPARHVPDLALLEVPVDAVLAVCGSVGLWSIMADRATGVPGDVVAVRWVWEVFGVPDESADVILELLDAGGERVHHWNLPPVAAWWPPDAWTGGERWVGRHIVRLPGDLAGGTYSKRVRWPGCEDDLAQADLLVVAPQRSWTVPEALSPVEVGFAEGGGDLVALVGVELSSVSPAPGEGIEVTLAWQAVAAIQRSYHVFLHLVDGQGRVVAQSDGVPVAWTRPTTGWAVGEVVVETRQLVMPDQLDGAGYQLLLGLYEPGGARLRVAGEGDTHSLAILESGK
jgi:hypothetical protein